MNSTNSYSAAHQLTMMFLEPFDSFEDPVPVPAWDADEVRRLIRGVRWVGEEPAFLVVGRREAQSLKAFFSSQFDESETVPLKSQTYAGLKIFEADEESHLQVEPARPVGGY